MTAVRRLSRQDLLGGLDFANARRVADRFIALVDVAQPRVLLLDGSSVPDCCARSPAGTASTAACSAASTKRSRSFDWSHRPLRASVHAITDTASPAAAVPRRIRVALADDSFLMREAVHQVVEHHDDVEIVADCGDGATLLDEVRRTQPDVVVTDVRMPPSGDDEGIRVAQRLRETDPDIGVVVLSHYAEPRYGFELFADGAEGRAYLLKDRLHDGRQLRAAIEVVARGGSMIDPEMVRLLLESEERERDSPLAELTPREREVLAAMAAGKSNAAIAEELVLTKRAVEKHVGAIFLKLGLPGEDLVSRRVAAVLLYLANERT